MSTTGSATMDRTMQVQLQIRQNAEEISTALKEIGQWEKAIKKKDQQRSKAPRASVSVSVSNSTSTSASTSASSHSSLRTGGGTVPLKASSLASTSSSSGNSNSNPAELTPASIVNASQVVVPETRSVPKALGKFELRDPEEIERERGNQEFKAGNFAAAAKSYTKCLGLKSQNYIAFSNRAMTYLKLKEYSRALLDCNSALHIEPTHVKTLMRRATAFNAVGKHRAALRDLLRAAELEPTNKQVKVDTQQTKELLRSSVNRAPLVAVNYIDTNSLLQSSSQATSYDGVDSIQGPDLLPSGELVKYEEPDVQDGFQRIQILDDEENEEDVDHGASQSVSSPSTHSPKIEESADIHSTISTSAANTEKQATEKLKVKAKTTKKVVDGNIIGAYELEKTIHQLQRDDRLLTKFVVGLKRKALCATFNKTQQLEPSVVYLLLRAISEVHGRINSKWVKVVEWFESIGQLPAFGLLYQLMIDDERSELQQYLVQALKVCDSELDTTRKVALLRIYSIK